MSEKCNEKEYISSFYVADEVVQLIENRIGSDCEHKDRLKILSVIKMIIAYYGFDDLR